MLPLRAAGRTLAIAIWLIAPLAIEAWAQSTTEMGPTYLRRDNIDVSGALERCEGDLSGMRARLALIERSQKERHDLWQYMDDIERCRVRETEEGAAAQSFADAQSLFGTQWRLCEEARRKNLPDENCQAAENTRVNILQPRRKQLATARQAKAEVCTPRLREVEARLTQIEQAVGSNAPVDREIADLRHQIALHEPECQRLHDTLALHTVLGPWRVPESSAMISFEIVARRDADLLIAGVVRDHALDEYAPGETIFRNIVRVTPVDQAPDGAQEFVGRFLSRDADGEH